MTYPLFGIASKRAAYGALVLLTLIWGMNWMVMKLRGRDCRRRRLHPVDGDPRLAPAGTASLNMFAIPVLALESSMLIFGERLTIGEWFSITSIGVGLAIVSARAWLASRGGEREPVEAPAMEGG